MELGTTVDLVSDGIYVSRGHGKKRRRHPECVEW